MRAALKRMKVFVVYAVAGLFTGAIAVKNINSTHHH